MLEINPPARRWTHEDLATLPDDGQRYEVLEGRLVVSPSPVIAHQTILFNLARKLGDLLHEPGLARVLFAPCDVRLSPTTTVQPDLIVVAAERAAIIGDKCITGAPDLLVEILSPSTASTDRGDKLRLYGAAGVAEVWLIHPAAHTVERFVPDGAGIMLPRATHAATDAVACDRFPSLTFAAAGLFTP